MNLAQFTLNQKYLMLALDHRGSFKKMMSPQNPDLVGDGEVIELKSRIINALINQISGLLIDETYGLKAYPVHDKPFLLPVEKTGYTQVKEERVTEIEYSVDQLKDWGAGGAKILIYFNPQIESAKIQLQTAKKVLDECRSKDFPLFLEIVTYQPSGEYLEKDRPHLVLNSIRTFLESGIKPDVFKLQYPGDKETCYRISQLLDRTPWVLLTGGDSFENFRVELEDAASAGALGFLAGRALWQEACSLKEEELEKFLSKVLPKRFDLLSKIVNT